MSEAPIFLNTRQAAEFLGVSPAWLELCRSRGDGPPYVCVGEKLIKYRRKSLEQWMAEHERQPETEGVS